MALFPEQTINYFKKIIKVAWHFSDFTVSHILGGLKSKPPAQLQAKKKKKKRKTGENKACRPGRWRWVKTQVRQQSSSGNWSIIQTASNWVMMSNSSSRSSRSSRPRKVPRDMGTVGVGLKKWDSADWIEFRQGRNDFGLSYSAVIKFSSQKSLPANICLVKQLRSQKKKKRDTDWTGE